MRFDQWTLAERWRLVLTDLAQFEGSASHLLQEAKWSCRQDENSLFATLIWPQSFANDLEQLQMIPNIHKRLEEYFSTVLEQEVHLVLELSNEEDSPEIIEWAALRPLANTKEFSWRRDQMRKPQLKILEELIKIQLIESRSKESEEENDALDEVPIETDEN